MQARREEQLCVLVGLFMSSARVYENVSLLINEVLQPALLLLAS